MEHGPRCAEHGAAAAGVAAIPRCLVIQVASDSHARAGDVRAVGEMLLAIVPGGEVEVFEADLDRPAHHFINAVPDGAPHVNAAFGHPVRRRGRHEGKNLGFCLQPEHRALRAVDESGLDGRACDHDGLVVVPAKGKHHHRGQDHRDNGFPDQRGLVNRLHLGLHVVHLVGQVRQARTHGRMMDWGLGGARVAVLGAELLGCRVVGASGHTECFRALSQSTVLEDQPPHFG